jgi:hypothetical protein
MDNDKDDKSIIDKTLEAVKDIAAIAAEAAHKAMEPEPITPGDEVVTRIAGLVPLMRRSSRSMKPSRIY